MSDQKSLVFFMNTVRHFTAKLQFIFLQMKLNLFFIDGAISASFSPLHLPPVQFPPSRSLPMQ